MLPMRATTQTLEPTAGFRLHLDRLAGAGPALVYLHGLGSVRAGEKSDALFALAARLGIAAVRFDFRGHGDSDGELGETTLSDLLGDTRAVLRDVGPALLVGSSLGGLVAAWCAATSPELVTGLTLIAPAFGFLSRLERTRTADGSAHVVSGEREIRIGPEVLADLRRFDESRLPAMLRARTLLVHGADDDVVPVDATRAVFDAIRHADKDLWIVPGGDHRLNKAVAAIYDRMARFHGLR